MSITSDQVATLLEWCAVNAILIDEQVCLSVGSEEHDGLSIGLGVYSADAFIPPHTTRQSTPNGLPCGTSGLTHTVSNGLLFAVVKIRKDAVLSVRTCSLAQYISFVPYGLGAQLSLSLALYAEMYVQVLIPAGILW